MSKHNNGGAAFPRPVGGFGDGYTVYRNDAAPGMSLRDWFAGMVVQGLLANCFQNAPETTPETFSATAYKFADALLAAREAPDAAR